jgi:hypothetical protein
VSESCVFGDPACRGSSQRLLQGEKKITEGERDPALAGSAAVGITERKRRTEESFKTKEWTRVEEKEGAIARKMKRGLDIWIQGSLWFAAKAHLGSAVRCTGWTGFLCSERAK